ncbi:MAG: acyl-CoA thioesterase [Paracoccaceae bacterium]
MNTEPKGMLVMQAIAMPADTNANGDIFGGWLMAQMDLGASVIARTRSCGKVATVAVNAMAFHKPVLVGDLVTIYAALQKTGTTSMHITVEVWVTRLPSQDRLKVTQATFIFVAVDGKGEKRHLPKDIEQNSPDI